MGVIYYFGRQYERAIDELNKVLHDHPDFATARWGLGLACERKGVRDQVSTCVEAELRVFVICVIGVICGQLVWRGKYMNWQEHLRAQGYAHFAGITPESLVTSARKAIELDLSSNYEPERQVEYDNRSYCPDLRATPPIMNLLIESPVLNVLDEVFGLDKIDWDKGQIAIRRAHNHPKPIPPTPHIDGFSTGLNGLEKGRIYNHTVTVGVFLTPTRNVFAGNFTVWPGSHYVYERYFRERGPRAMSEPMPTPEIGGPVQLMCKVGDVVLAHYQLGHNAAVNTSDFDRIAIFFRIWLRDVELDRWHHLTNIWEGWKL